jgi:integrase
MPGSAYIFRGVKDARKPLAYELVRDTFREVAAVAKVPACTLHTLRHWFVTQTANSVSNPRVGMALTGHRSHQAYMHYVHGDREQARALAEQLASVTTGLGATATLPTEPVVVKLPVRRKRRGKP